jgi:hypothetical protein
MTWDSGSTPKTEICQTVTNVGQKVGKRRYSKERTQQMKNDKKGNMIFKRKQLFFSVSFFTFDTILLHQQVGGPLRSQDEDERFYEPTGRLESRRLQSAVHQLKSKDDDILTFGNSVMKTLTYPNDFTLVFELHDTSVAHSKAKKIE